MNFTIEREKIFSPIQLIEENLIYILCFLYLIYISLLNQSKKNFVKLSFVNLPLFTRFLTNLLILFNTEKLMFLKHAFEFDYRINEIIIFYFYNMKINLVFILTIIRSITKNIFILNIYLYIYTSIRESTKSYDFHLLELNIIKNQKDKIFSYENIVILIGIVHFTSLFLLSNNLKHILNILLIKFIFIFTSIKSRNKKLKRELLFFLGIITIFLYTDIEFKQNIIFYFLFYKTNHYIFCGIYLYLCSKYTKYNIMENKINKIYY